LKFFTSVPKFVIDELYKQQLERDFIDDFQDLEEDLYYNMPNPLLIRLRKLGLINWGKKYNQRKLEKLVLKSKAYDSQKNLILEITKKLKYKLLKKYLWIRKCNPIYFK